MGVRYEHGGRGGATYDQSLNKADGVKFSQVTCIDQADPTTQAIIFPSGIESSNTDNSFAISPSSVSCICAGNAGPHISLTNSGSDILDIQNVSGSARFKFKGQTFLQADDAQGITISGDTLEINFNVVYCYAPFQPAMFDTATRTGLSPEEGWVVYDTDLHQLCYYDGSSWVLL